MNMIMSECENTSMGNTSVPEMSSEALLEKKVRYYFMDLGVPLVCAFGLIGNVLNLMVLTREKIHLTLTKMEKSAHIGLIALAVSDFMFCLLALMFTILPSESSYTEMTPVLYYEWLGSSFITIFIITSTWLIVVMAGERYLAVCHPFKARNFISLRRTRVTIFLVFTLCVFSCLPLFFENVIATKVCYDNTFVYSIEERVGYGRKAIQVRRMVWAVLFDFIPSAALLYFNTCLIWKIHKAKKLRKQMAPGQNHDYVIYRSNGRENSTYSNTERDYTEMQSILKTSVVPKSPNGNHKNSLQRPILKQPRISTKAKKKTSDNALNSVTATLVAVVVLFLILVSPSEILKFTYSNINEGNKAPNFTLKMIRHITNFMQSLNFSFNFVLYCSVNKSFRETLAGLFCFCSKPALYDNRVRRYGKHTTHIQDLT